MKNLVDSHYQFICIYLFIFNLFLIKFQSLLPSSLSMSRMVPRKSRIELPKVNPLRLIWPEDLTARLTALTNFSESPIATSGLPTALGEL